MQGELSTTPLAESIRELYASRRSGILHLARDDVKKRVYFRKGNIIFANSDEDSERLGEFLIRGGFIDRETYEAATDAMRTTGQRFGRTLVEMGVCTTVEMEAKVAEQIQSIVYSAFVWNAGSYEFEQHESPVDEDIVLNLSTADIILEGIRRMEDIGSIRRTLGEENATLAHSENPLLLYQKISLNPSEGFVLSRVDGTASVSDIAALSPLGEDETMRCIYGLVSAGVLELKSRGVKVPNASVVPPPTPETTPDPRPASDVPSAPSVPDSQAAPPPTEPEPAPRAEPSPRAAQYYEPPPSNPVASAGPSAEENAIKDEITAKHASLTDATYYELLEVERDAADEDIKKAYYSMAKKYHPDRHHSHHLRDVHGLLEELFVKITNAYQSLSSTLERGVYDRKLAAMKPAKSEQPKAEPYGHAMGGEQAARLAAEHFHEGKKHFYEMHFFDAIQCLKESVRLVPDNFHYNRLLAQALLKNPLWRKDAEQHFRNALQLEPFDADCFVGLGEIYEDAGMTMRATKMFQQALSYDPENEEALKRLGPPTDEGAGGVSGFESLKRFFGRKKD